MFDHQMASVKSWEEAVSCWRGTPVTLTPNDAGVPPSSVAAAERFLSMVDESLAPAFAQLAVAAQVSSLQRQSKQL